MEIYTISLPATNKKHKNIFHLPITRRHKKLSIADPSSDVCKRVKCINK